jgi:endonuclease/exonuclease/phosphatase family metal-dependent hydrolase
MEKEIASVIKYALSLLLILPLLGGCIADNEKSTGPAVEEALTDETDDDQPAIAYADYVFTEYDWQTAEPDVVNERLCSESANPDAVSDPINIDCALEGASFAPSASANEAAADEIVIMAYNLERGHYVDEQIAAILENDEVAVPDIILISESDRGCERTSFRNVIRAYAEALGYYYIYGVEYLELYTDGAGEQKSCEHGNGIVSRFPLGNAELIRHNQTDTWGGRLGGRMTIHATADTGERYLHLYSLHMSSGADETSYRASLINELIAHAADKPFDVIIGGDTNAWVYSMDLASGASNDQVIVNLTEAGYHDSHRELEYGDRISLSSGLVLDLIFANRDIFQNPAVCPAAICEGLSDHLPVWATILP